ncbi:MULTISPECIES: DUF2784 domain-containing protein [Halomonadaceae]|uniref:DUF2784 domain-containing protein n=1 Tax=Halomonadaceae TaxID=28256 RepID=UPI0012F27FDA|nr:MULTISPECIES: DUF2784 domain-containing protein [Halomonas]CAD5261353.1 Membrane protein [Halomonas sp. 156]CAD5287661.1 Membrane protein [Halomonas sp. 113]CAD5289196.1 Membrane protein [Halomonas sp. 59]CAD5292175.1 Membrane protein [Halomonas sp. I3]VXB42397.1 Membrane protein [Halomonas titanicae]
MPPSLLLMLADILLILHVLFVAFVVLGLVTIYAGYFFNWRWARNKTFRIVHLCAIGYVVVQAWLGVVCPLTTWEMALRAEAGAVTYSGSFIQNWLHSLLYFTFPEWVFAVVYTLFGSLVLASWFVVKPRQHSS